MKTMRLLNNFVDGSIDNLKHFFEWDTKLVLRIYPALKFYYAKNIIGGKCWRTDGKNV